MRRLLAAKVSSKTILEKVVTILILSLPINLQERDLMRIYIVLQSGMILVRDVSNIHIKSVNICPGSDKIKR